MFLKSSSKLAIVDFDNRKISYKEMVDSIKYLSRNIYVNIKKNDKVLIIAENRLEWIYSFFAIWDRLATPIPVDALSTKDEIEYFLKDSGANAVIVTNKTKKLVEGKLNIDVYNLDELDIKQKEDEIELDNPKGDDLALMIYTSGTTGNPKGVMLSFNNIEAEMEGIKSLGFTFDDEMVLAILPFHHIFPLVSTGLYFYHYKQMYSVVLVPSLTSAEIFRCLKQNRVTGLSAVPRVYKLFYDKLKEQIDSKYINRLMFKLAKLIDSPKFSKIVFKKVHDAFGGHLRTLVSGGGKSDIEMIEFFNTLGFLYCEGYGLSETSPVVAGSGRTNYKPGTIGKPIKNCDIKIVDEELLVKSPVVMLGYYNNPLKTKEVMTEDGYFKTGDRASIDDEGYITILGRINEMIVLSNGKNVNPIILEDMILKLSNNIIGEVAIFGQDDKLKAIIVPNREYIVSNKIGNITTHIRDIIEIYNSKVHNYQKVLDYKIIEDELPKTRVGKIQRFKLKDIHLGNTQKKIVENEPTTDEYIFLKEYVKKAKKLSVISPTDNLEIELGLDSLDLVEFRTHLENTYNIKLTDDIFVTYNNLLLLSEYIRKNATEFNDIKVSTIEDVITNTYEKKKLKSSFLAKIISPFIYILSKIYFRLSIIKSSKIKDEPTIFIANHQSFIDAPLLALAIPYKIRMKTYFLGLEMYFKSPFMSFVANNFNIVKIDIEKNIKKSVQEIVNILKSGGNIFIFPEGSRTKDGNLQEFKKIYAIIAKELNIDIQCISIDGAYEAYSRFDKFPKPKKITVKVLKRIKAKDRNIDDIVNESIQVFSEK